MVLVDSAVESVVAVIDSWRVKFALDLASVGLISCPGGSFLENASMLYGEEAEQQVSAGGEGLLGRDDSFGIGS